VSNPRRFPPPWTVEETEGSFIVTDNTGQKLAYVYFEEEPGRRSDASLLTKDEARRIALNTAKLPDLLQRRKTWGGPYPRDRKAQPGQLVRPDLKGQTFPVQPALRVHLVSPVLMVPAVGWVRLVRLVRLDQQALLQQSACTH
jgi:hypothetical protein